MTIPESAEQHNNKNVKSKKNKIKIWTLSILSIIIIVAALIWYNKQFLIVYYMTATNNHFKINDKLYAQNWLVNETPKYGSYSLSLYRKIRPLNDDDVDAMQIELWKKALIKKNLNSSNKPCIMECVWAISTDSLCKYKTACIGNYTGVEILNMHYADKYHPFAFFSITTNKKALVREEEIGLTKVPDGYTFDDGPFYVMAQEVTNKELKTFRTIKK